jgi:hypothetical protein
LILGYPTHICPQKILKVDYKNLVLYLFFMPATPHPTLAIIHPISKIGSVQCLAFICLNIHADGNFWTIEGTLTGG